MTTRIYNVFAANPFEGNATGVVHWEGPEDELLMQKIATNLAVPDTIFIIGLNENQHNNTVCQTRTFSPNGEMAICGQGLVAVFNDLEENGFIVDRSTKVGTKIGVSEAIKKEGIYFVSMGKATVERIDECNQLREWIKSNDKDDLNPIIHFVDLGRKRLLVQVELDQLAFMQPDEKWVQSTCNELGITGIVFFSNPAPGQVRSRHFTLSLDGREDAVTGGASGAISAILHQLGQNSLIHVHQGNFTGNGGLITCFLDENQEIFIGGNAILQLEGKLIN